jgi:hypothetical protein
MEAGAEFIGGCAVTQLEQANEGGCRSGFRTGGISARAQAKASSSGSINFPTGQCQSIKWNMHS